MAQSSNNVINRFFPLVISKIKLWLRMAGGFTARFIVILVMLVIATWLLYQNLWRPLQEEITLPAGVLDTNPLLRSELLQGINEDRAERSRYQPGSYSGYSRLFTAPDAQSTPVPQQTGSSL